MKKSTGKKPIYDREKTLELHLSGKDIYEIAEVVGGSPISVRQWLIYHKHKPNFVNNERRGRKVTIDYQKVEELYNKGMSAYLISVELRVCYRSVKKWIVKREFSNQLLQSNLEMVTT